MDALRFTLHPRTAFATPLQGDTLFGQLCWTIRHGWGEARLLELLNGYDQGQPFLVLSDAFPVGHVPLPSLPAAVWQTENGSLPDPSQRKQLKKRVWVPLEVLDSPLPTWQRQAQTAEQLHAGQSSRPQAHNSINRLTQTTGDGFAPYSVSQHWYQAESLEVHARLDSARFSADDLHAALGAIGQFGYGKDASTGLGKFDLDAPYTDLLAPAARANAWLTLAPCAPQDLGLAANRCFYKPFTRYGRHGDVAVLSGQPFKKPLLLAATGAVLSPRQEPNWQRGWIGQGLGGSGPQGIVSTRFPSTVHQGYAPALAIHLPETICHQEAA